MEKTLEITAKNGISYKFVEWTLFRTMVDTYSWYNNKWNRIGKSFDSMEDAKAWIEELNADYEARMNAPATIGANWRWRLSSRHLDEKRRQWIRNLAAVYRR